MSIVMIGRGRSSRRENTHSLSSSDTASFSVRRICGTAQLERAKSLSLALSLALFPFSLSWRVAMRYIYTLMLFDSFQFFKGCACRPAHAGPSTGLFSMSSLSSGNHQSGIIRAAWIFSSFPLFFPSISMQSNASVIRKRLKLQSPEHTSYTYTLLILFLFTQKQKLCLQILSKI